MTHTILIILAAGCIIAAAVNLYFSIKYRRLFSEYQEKIEDLERQEKGLQKRHNALDRWAHELKEQCRRQNERDERHRHVYANVEVRDNAEKKPSKKEIGKRLSSKIGYAVRRAYPEIRETRDESNGGRTVFSVDFFVTPYYEQHGNA